jgi:hypothetical protein
MNSVTSRIVQGHPIARDNQRMTPAAVFALLLSMAPLSESQEGAARAMLAGARCADAALGQLASWGAEFDRSVIDPPEADGTRAVRLPTGALGVWLRLVVTPSGDVWLERLSTARQESRRYGPGCVPETASESAPMNRPDVFTDEALSARLARGDAGVILVWSPHMPLSVDQFDVLVSVTRDLGVGLVVALDPSADSGYARQVARERNLPDAALLPLGGIELPFRGMTTHAPSMQVFSGGRLVGPVLYGYRAAETARLAIEGVLAGRK